MTLKRQLNCHFAVYFIIVWNRLKLLKVLTFWCIQIIVQYVFENFGGDYIERMVQTKSFKGAFML